MRLQVRGAPDIIHRRLADALLLRQRPTTPVRHPCRLRLQRCAHNRGDLTDRVGRFSTSARSYIPQPVQPRFDETLSPENHRIAVYRKPSGDRGIGFGFRNTKYNPTPKGHLLRSAVRGNPLLKLLPIHCGKLEGNSQLLRFIQTRYTCLVICWTVH